MTAASITIPYAGLDLTVSNTITNTTMYYFPLKRARRADQLILGRVFLRWVHVSVDYESGYFNFSQRRFGPSNSTDIPDIVPIVPISRDERVEAPARIPVGAYVGIAIGAAMLLILLLPIFVARNKGWRPFGKRKTVDDEAEYSKAELHNDAVTDIAVPPVEAMDIERRGSRQAN